MRRTDSTARGKLRSATDAPPGAGNGVPDEEGETGSILHVREHMRNRRIDIQGFADELMPEPKRILPMKCENIIKDQETAYICEALEGFAQDVDNGFDEELFLACEKLLDHFEDDVKRSETLRVKLRRHGKRRFADSTNLSWYRRLLYLLEYPDSSKLAGVIYILVSAVVVLSCIVTIVETMPSFNPRVFPSFGPLWTGLDWFATSVLTIETIARFVAHVLDDTMPSSRTQNAVRFLRSPSNIIDLLSLLPTYTQYVFSAGRVVTGALRTLRLLRVLKFMRRFKQVRLVALAMRNAATSLVGPTLFLILCLLLFASTLYFAEMGTYNSETKQFELVDPICESEPRGILSLSKRVRNVNFSTVPPQLINFTCPRVVSHFTTIPQTIWWGIVTMPTIGYGDFVPITLGGKIITFVTIVFGLIFIAMPIAVIGTNFLLVMEQADREKARTRAEEVMRQEEYFQIISERSAIAAAAAAAATGGDASGRPPGSPGSPWSPSLPSDKCWRQPGEEALLKLRELTNATTVDLANPSAQILMIADVILEHAVKQFVNGTLEGDERPPMFKDVTTLPLWCSTTTTMPVYEAQGREDGDRVVERTIVSRPCELTVGAGGNGALDPDVVLVTAAMAETMIDHRIDRNEERAQLALEEAEAEFPQRLAIETMKLPQLRWTGISQRHALLTTIRTWGEQAVLLRNCPGCVVIVYRRVGHGSGNQFSRSSSSSSSSSSTGNGGRNKSPVQVHYLESAIPRTCSDHIANAVELADQQLLGTRRGQQQLLLLHRRQAATAAPGAAMDGGGVRIGGSQGGEIAASLDKIHDDSAAAQGQHDAALAAQLERSAVNFELERAFAAACNECEYFRLQDGDVIQFGGAFDSDFSDVISGSLRQQIQQHRQEAYERHMAKLAGDGPLLSRDLQGSGAESSGAGDAPAVVKAPVPPLEQLLVDMVSDCVFYRYGDNSNVV